MAAKTPLALVQEKFGDKAKLVEAVEKLTSEDLWVARTNADKGLAHVSNAKLLRLYSIFTEVKAKFGSREKLIDAILELDKRSKDTGLRQKLTVWPVPRLLDAYRSAAKRSRGPSVPEPARTKSRGAKATPAVRSTKKVAAAAKPARKTAKKKSSR
jgi:hypothetical protein